MSHWRAALRGGDGATVRARGRMLAARALPAGSCWGKDRVDLMSLLWIYGLK